VLQVYVQTEGEEPPPAFVLCISGEQFELGEALSPAAENNLRAAFNFLQTLCRNAQLPEWERAARA
jgi:hypothetical protein